MKTTTYAILLHLQYFIEFSEYKNIIFFVENILQIMYYNSITQENFDTNSHNLKRFDTFP